MIGYVGVPGALVALPYRGGLSTSTDRPTKPTRTLGGKVKFFVGPRARREWSVSFDLMGSREAAGLVEVARSAGEVMWYPADATSGNLLSPQASGFETVDTGVVDAGFVSLPDRSVARSVAGAGTVRVGSAHGVVEMVPVRGQSKVSVGAWGSNGLRFQGRWLDALGGSVGTYISDAGTFAGWQWRQYTMTPPAGAVFFDVQLFGGVQYARPCASWGTVAVDRPGRGAPKVVVHGLSEALTVVARDDAYGSIDATITEVG